MVPAAAAADDVHVGLLPCAQVCGITRGSRRDPLCLVCREGCTPISNCVSAARGSAADGCVGG